MGQIILKKSEKQNQMRKNTQYSFTFDHCAMSESKNLNCMHYEFISVSLQTATDTFLLMYIRMPIGGLGSIRQMRSETILRVLTWLKELRRKFDQPGLILPAFGHFLQALPFRTFNDIFLPNFDETLDNGMLCAHACATYELLLELEHDVDKRSIFLSRDLSDEEFSVKVCMFLM